MTDGLPEEEEKRGDPVHGDPLGPSSEVERRGDHS